MDMLVELTKERRARLAAERLLQFRQRELHEANAKLGKHANALTEEIDQSRQSLSALPVLLRWVVPAAQSSTCLTP